MKTVYGPVPSRRLGRSLGVDPVLLKTCNYNCVYCQLGRTVPLTNERRDFFPPSKILANVIGALAGWEARSEPPIDYITLVGQGEPLLCASLGWVIQQIKAHTGIRVAVITNGSLLYRPEVREELGAADVVLPSLDAADQVGFRRINRPWPTLSIDQIIEGLVAFRAGFAGWLWIEVMLVRGVNDDETSLLGIRDALRRIGPDQIHLGLPVRPPAEAWVQPPDDEGMIRATTILGEASCPMMPESGSFHLDNDLPLPTAIEEVIRRHPMRDADLMASLPNWSWEQIESILQQLVTEQRAQSRVYRGQRFWSCAQSQYGGQRTGDGTW